MNEGEKEKKRNRNQRQRASENVILYAMQSKQQKKGVMNQRIK